MNMNKYERLNQQKKYRSEKSFSGKKRVAAYCRVSTEKEEQAQSFESQCDFFRCYIEQKKEWEFYKGSLTCLLQRGFPVLREIRLTVFIIQENFARWESGFCF